ncbi:uncharacterized protein LOC123219879 [Mangifera indica]|uniref:uncharacterized protein LOC123219879 n=1 Tax=Mangifera indica TaxID=29780 RepID=UPI001CFA24FE|nr:uncharacterized protein LOC123219879 [Mangifera indica]
MEGPSVEQQLRNFIRNMRDQGILDHRFENLRRSEAHGDPQVLTDEILIFIVDADISTAEITSLMNNPALDYQTLGEQLYQLRRKTARVGGFRMVAACLEFCQAIDARDKARCVEGFHGIINEYRDFRICLVSILQMLEQLIQAQRLNVENRRRRP